ncbi:MAG: hypothetical protein DRN42_02475 [Thermoplasmata archaeon]|nr:MAG: hypothetical protein DRN42_02475 [Thermoplasmata archaeon]
MGQMPNHPRYIFPYMTSEKRLSWMVDEIEESTEALREAASTLLTLSTMLALRGYEGRFFPSFYVMGEPGQLTRRLPRTLPDPFENLKNPPKVSDKRNWRTFFNYSQFPGTMLLSPEGRILGVGRSLKFQSEKSLEEFSKNTGALIVTVGEDKSVTVVYPEGREVLRRERLLLGDPKREIYLKRSEEGLYRYYMTLEGDFSSLFNGGRLRLLSGGRSSQEYRKTLRNLLSTAFLLSLKGFGCNPIGAFFILGRYSDVRRYLVPLPTARYYSSRSLNIMIGDWKELYPFFTLDGAVAVSPEGRVWGVGRYVNISGRELERGGTTQVGGSKTQAASLITEKAPCIAVTVSVDGDIKVFEGGKQVAEFTRCLEELPPDRSRVNLFGKIKGYPYRGRK